MAVRKGASVERVSVRISHDRDTSISHSSLRFIMNILSAGVDLLVTRAWTE